jgi:hypothetical protein
MCVSLVFKKSQVRSQLSQIILKLKEDISQYNDIHLKMGIEPTAEMSCESNIHQTVENVQNNRQEA